MNGLKDIYNYIDSFAPFSSQLEWDNSGIIVNCGNTQIHKVLVTLDIDEDVFSEAVSGNYNLIVSHHPVIFKSVSSLDDKSIAANCFKNNISVISAHTNYDLSENGVNDVLAKCLNLNNIFQSEDACLKIGTLSEETDVESFANLVKEKLIAAVRYNCVPQKIKTVAVCGGAGSEFFLDAKELGADVFVTGDAKYHEFLEAKQNNIMLLAAGHYETEFPAVKQLCKLLSLHFPNIEFKVANEKSSVINI